MTGRFDAARAIRLMKSTISLFSSAGLSRGWIPIALSSVLAFACLFGEAPARRLSGPYLLLNGYSDTRLAYDLGKGSSIGRVSSRVVAAGADERHVIVKRVPDGPYEVHPRGPTLPDEVWTPDPEFYILDRSLDGPYVDPSACVFGPFDHDGFLRKRAEMNVSTNLRFTFSHD